MNEGIYSSPKFTSINSSAWDRLISNKSVKLGGNLEATARSTICHLISPLIFYEPVRLRKIA